MNVSYIPTARLGSASAIRGDRFELVDKGERRVLGDVAAGAESFLHREFDGGSSPDHSVESLGAERGFITKVEVNVTLERAIGVERSPAAAAHVVALVGALPRELHARPAITIRIAAVEFSRHRDEAQSAETVLIELDEAGLHQVDGLLIPVVHFCDTPPAYDPPTLGHATRVAARRAAITSRATERTGPRRVARTGAAGE